MNQVKLSPRFILLGFYTFVLIGLCASTYAATNDKERSVRDRFEMAEALIRHELSDAKSYMYGNRKFPFYVSVAGLDIPPEVIANLADTGVSFFPGSAWTAPTDSKVRMDRIMSMNIGILRPRPDGNYDVSFGFYCGSLCGSGNTAVMSHDASGWHVIGSKMNRIFNTSGASIHGLIRRGRRIQIALPTGF